MAARLDPCEARSMPTIACCAWHTRPNSKSGHSQNFLGDGETISVAETSTIHVVAVGYLTNLKLAGRRAQLASRPLYSDKLGRSSPIALPNHVDLPSVSLTTWAGQRAANPLPRGSWGTHHSIVRGCKPHVRSAHPCVMIWRWFFSCAPSPQCIPKTTIFLCNIIFYDSNKEWW